MNIQDRIGKTNWFDLPVSDPVNARSFYEALFNWQFLLMNHSAIENYWVIQAGEELIGGIRQVPPTTPPIHAPVLYFTVDHLNPYISRVKELGGLLVGEKVDLGQGRGSYQWFRDREGNLVSLWSPENSVGKEN